MHGYGMNLICSLISQSPQKTTLLDYFGAIYAILLFYRFGKIKTSEEEKADIQPMEPVIKNFIF